MFFFARQENNDQSKRSGVSAAAAISGNDKMVMGGGSSKGRGTSIICDSSSSSSSSSSVGSIADDIICGSAMCYDGSNSQLTLNNYGRGSRSGSAIIDRTSAPAPGAGYSNSSVPTLLRGSAAGSTGHGNRAAGVSISCDNLSSLELEMTYDPHGCMYGPEGCLTPDSTWKKHLEFLAHIPGYIE